MSAQIQSTRSGLDFQGDVWTRSSVSCWEFLEATKVHWSSGWRNSDHGSLSSSCTTNEQVEVGQAGSTGRCRQTVTSQPTPLSSLLSLPTSALYGSNTASLSQQTSPATIGTMKLYQYKYQHFNSQTFHFILLYISLLFPPLALGCKYC